MPLFIIIILGKFFKTIGLYDDCFIENANRFLFNILLPALVFNSIYIGDYRKNFDLKLVVFILILLVATAMVSWIIVPYFERDNSKKGVIIQSLFRNNYVLIGIPLCKNLYGETYLGIATMVLAFYIPVMNLLAAIVLSYYSGKNNMSVVSYLLDVAKNPFVISTLSAVFLSTFSIKFPYVIEVVIKDISVVANPLALLVLGGSLDLPIMFKYMKRIISISVIKLIILPAIILLISICFGMRGIDLVIILSVFGSSTGIASHSMALQMKSDHILAGALVTSTILLSSVTLFFFVLLLRSHGFI